MNNHGEHEGHRFIPEKITDAKPVSEIIGAATEVHRVFAPSSANYSQSNFDTLSVLRA
jgi:hypothetical protein